MKNIKLSIFFVVVFGTCAGMIPQKVSAQEFIKEYLWKDRRSIIRELSREQWVVFNDYSLFNVFTLVDPSNPLGWHIIAPTPFVEPVNDFEILNNQYVFFCGGGNLHPWMGYFDMSGFGGAPTQVVHTFDFFLTVWSVVNLKKLEVFVVGEELHVVMIGERNGGGPDCVIDAVQQSPNSFTFYYGDAPRGQVFDDIAVTLLEACEKDAFVAAWHPSSSSDVMLSAFDGLNHRSPSSGL